MSAEKNHGACDWLRRFNKRVTNRITMSFAGKRVYAIVHHTGRKSGRLYQTPVVAMPSGDGFVIPLPYGEDVDWCSNLLAAGGCRLDWRGMTYTLCEPTIIEPAAALPAFPRWQGFLLRHTRRYLRLKQM